MTDERVRRRLSAILAADVVGYSRLMRADEEGTLARLKALRRDLIDPGLDEHGGRIVKLMGDGMLVEFASVVDAVRSAAAIQTAVADRNSSLSKEERVTFRVGVNLGDVVIDGDDIYGDGVNVAARLEAMAEPGGICISGGVHDQVRDRIDLPFMDMGEQKVKNIDRPVRAWRWRPGDSATTGHASSDEEAPLPLPRKPSIAVLPFDNMSGDPEQEYFADGITEDIITELSKFRTLFVIARNSSFAFKGQALDVRQIGAKLGVRYVVEGSVRRAGNRVRVTAQLIDAAEDQHIWAERFDGSLDDIFAVQDEVTRAIITAIEPQLAISERKRALRKPPESLDAWENYQRGMWHVFQYRPKDRDAAIGFLRRAIEIDPAFASAYAGLGYALYVYIILGASPNRDVDLKELLEVSQTAVRLDDNDPFAWVALARAYLLSADHNASITASDRAISLNPNFTLAHFGRAHACWHAGRPAEAIPSHDEAMRLSPHDPLISIYMASKAIALLMLGRHEEAVEWSRRSQQQANAAIFSHFGEISALGLLGRIEEAQDAIERARTRKPDVSMRYISETLPITDRQCRQLFHDGLRKAGLPE